MKNNFNLNELDKIQTNDADLSYINGNDDFLNKLKITDFESSENYGSLFVNSSYSNTDKCPFEKNLSFSMPIPDDRRIKFFTDPSYCSQNSKYIKYNPIDEYIPPVPFDKKKSPSTIGKINTINFCKRDKMNIDNENEIDGFIYSDDEKEELFPILSIPRIKPSRDEYILKIKNKLTKDGIKCYQIEDEKLKKEEKSLYADSFTLYDQVNDIKVYVPCYRNNLNMEEFKRNKNLEVTEFQEDNDIDTDEEQLEMEIERNKEAFVKFMECVESEKNYIEKNLHRKKKKEQ